jgi:hypothetical protein
MTIEERRAIIARRDKEAERQRQVAAYAANPEHYRRKGRRAYDRNPDAWNTRSREWKAAHPEASAESRRRWAEQNREKRRAHHAVQTAIRRGDMERPATCSVEGCNAKPHAHHEDYSKPLEVEWICQRHHNALHREKRGLPR